MNWQDWLRLFRVAVAVALAATGTFRLNHGDSPTAIWAFILGGFILLHVIIWDPLTAWLSKGPEGEDVAPLQKTWVETMREMMGWLFASASIIIGFLVTQPTHPAHFESRNAADRLLLLSKVGVAVLASGIFFGVFYITTLVTSLKDREKDVVIKRKVLAAATVLLHLTFWGLLGGLIAVVVRFIES
jgi:hypothetical protein